MAHLDEIELDLEELQDMENEGRTDQTPVQELRSVGIGKGLAHRAGRIVFNAPIVFLGDQSVEPLALLFQTNGLRAMVIIKLLTDVIWWQKLSGRAVINDICRMVVLRAEMWAECFLPFVGQLCEQWRRTGRRVVWFGKPININGLICLTPSSSEDFNLDFHFMLITEKKVELVLKQLNREKWNKLCYDGGDDGAICDGGDDDDGAFLLDPADEAAEDDE